MTMHDHLMSAKVGPHSAWPFRLSDFGSSRGTRIAAWIATAADYYTAAVVYEQLCRLSGAELHRIGLSRATLGWDIAQACDRATPRLRPTTLLPANLENPK
jgi:hypothetical protein